MRSIWKLLYDNGTDVVLSGHDHIYERFAPQTSTGVLDNARGIREFIIGTGGANHTAIESVAANSQLRNATTYRITFGNRARQMAVIEKVSLASGRSSRRDMARAWRRTPPTGGRPTRTSSRSGESGRRTGLVCRGRESVYPRRMARARSNRSPNSTRRAYAARWERPLLCVH